MDQIKTLNASPRTDGDTIEGQVFPLQVPEPSESSQTQFVGSDPIPMSNSPSYRRSAPYSFSQPPPKRICVEKPADEAQLKSTILEWKKQKLHFVAGNYNDNLIEFFLIENNMNLLDMHTCLKNPSPHLAHFIEQNKLKNDDTLVEKILHGHPSSLKIKDDPDRSPHSKNLSSRSLKKVGYFGGKPKSNSTQESSGTQQDQIVEKAKQEAYVMQRISSLRKEGMWGEKKLPKIQEPARPKAHWDYLLEEMVWLSADFAQERKWKKAAAKKCAKMVMKYFQDKNVQALKAEKEHELKLRKIAAFAAREVRTFWTNIGKLVEFKVNTRLDEKKKKALDQQLSFIVDQTEKYSSMLAESMKKTESNVTSRSQSPLSDKHLSDDEFMPDEPSDDNEETIGKEDDNPEEQASEVQLLQKESEQSLEDLLNELPPEYFQTSKTQESEKKDEVSSEPDSKMDSGSVTPDDKESHSDVDQDFEAVDSSEDDEQTIEEQENKETGEDGDHKNEIKELEAENEMSVEEIRKKYENLAATSTAPEEEEEEGSDDSDDDSSSDVSMKTEESDEERDSKLESEDEEMLGLEDLMDQSFTHLDDEPSQPMSKERSKEVDKELEDASAVAQSLQPKGFTLSSTSVTTPVPFLLKHTLREYQHVGLDWLVTMYGKKLNGILADEMGLGKTIQTIALLAHLACEKEIWGPHLIVVPTSVMLNWEMELKKWCPAFKILTYYGSQKERKMKRQGWTKNNSFHICITSYKLVIQDHQSFRRKRWRYLILDEAQNIKNFKSQRWQLLLNFQSQRRLLLTGTPLQNNLMELWSLMHFLMPNIFASHREFREWFSNPVTGMIEGNKEYNESIIKRLHKVLRPFILRRLKSEVEQQMPKKYEHVVMCRLSKRQRFLYEEFMSRTKTKETLASGNFLSVINILMQLRKVCNHPNLFEPRPTVSPFMMEGLTLPIPSLVYNVFTYDPFKHVDLFSLNILLSELESCLTAFAAHRIRRFQAAPKLIHEIDSMPEPPPKCPAGKIRLHVRPSSQPLPKPGAAGPNKAAVPSIVTLKPVNSTATPSAVPSAPSSNFQTGVRFQLVQHGGSYKAIPLPPGSTGGMLMQQTPQGPKLIVPQRASPAASPVTTSAAGQPVTAGLTTASSTASGGVTGLQLVQTSVGQYLLTSSALQRNPAGNSSSSAIGLTGTTAVALLQRLQGLKGLQGSVITTGAGGRPVLRLPTSSLRPNVVTTAAVSPSVTTTASTSSISTPKIAAVAASPVSQVPAPTQPSSKPPSCPSTPPSQSANPSPMSSPVRSIQTRSGSQSSDAKEPDSRSSTPKKKEDVANKSIFFMNELEEERKSQRVNKLRFISNLNTRRCHACPIYGSDLIEAVSVTLGPLRGASLNRGSFNGQGLMNCLNAVSDYQSQFWYCTSHLGDIVRTPEEYLDMLKEVTDHFVFCVPPVVARSPTYRVFHPDSSKYWKDLRQEMVFECELQSPLKPLHPIVNASTTQFPDPRLIQYDCGKLQTLDKLLRQLKSGSHRVLIFTQMTRMLDIFEAFLNFHGHLYLRLDGATKVENRQTLMERFNQDKRIFVFILSTRSGGIGVNLTGADTVIFYDSDWNPTMDAQAQDRCHRIGQTRDVHIYRLISEKTVEENILKKANQKRLLGDLAIEGGNFTTASLKKTTIHDLFEVDASEQDASKRMKEVLESKANEEGDKDTSKIGALESALAAAEDETDVEATKVAKAEAAAELHEFDEEAVPVAAEDEEDVSKAEQEVAILMKQLTPIEKYAMQFLEDCDEGLNAEVERLAAEIEEQKKEWELGRIQALRDEEKRLKELEDDDDALTYSAVNAHNQMWVSYYNEVQIMPIWRPPTPPRDENDLYVDRTLDYWYDSLSTMNESDLPPVFIKKENNKRIKIEASAICQSPLSGSPVSDSSSTVVIRGGLKVKREDAPFAPRSLFERRDPKKDVKLFKYRSLARPPLTGLKPQQLIGKATDSEPLMEWLVHEDWAIVQTIQQILQLPLNLSLTALAHIPNWDLVCDLVNAFSVCYRSQRQCRSRYENSLIVREEAKEASSPDATVTKKTAKKQKFLSTGQPGRQNFNSRGMGTFQLFQQDNNSKFSSLCSTRFETIKSITVKKNPTMKPMHVNPTAKNAKHAQVLSTHGVQYEEPLSPSQVATNRAERIQCEKQKQKSQAELTQHQTRVQIQNQNQSQITVSQLQRQLQQAQGQHQIALVAAPGSSIAQQQQPVVVSTGALTGKVTSSVVLNQGIANNLVTAITVSGSIASSAIPTIVTASATVVTTSVLSGVRATVAANPSSGSTATGRTTLTLQDLQQTRTVSGTQPTVVSVAGLSQLQTAKLAALTSQTSQQRGAVAGVPVQTRTLIPQQMQYLRQAQRQTLALHSGKVVATSTTGDQQTIKRVQMVKPGTIVATAGTSSVSSGTAGKTVTRTVTESEMNALFRRQPPQIAKVGQFAQMLAKQRSLVGLKGTTVGLQLGGKAGIGSSGMGTVQILQGGTQKQMTVQQIQQVFKQVQQQQSQIIQQGTISGAVVGKTIAGTSSSPGTNVGTLTPQAALTSQATKLIPVTVTSQQPPIKQTIQVVSAGTTAAGGSNLRVASGDRGTGFTVQGSAVRVASPAVLSLGPTALHGQPVSMAVRNPTPTTVRIQTTTSNSGAMAQSTQLSTTTESPVPSESEVTSSESPQNCM